MTSVPVPRQPSQSSDIAGGGTPSPDITPVFALKQLVSRLRREQNKIQDLLGSLGFALRSFNNLTAMLDHQVSLALYNEVQLWGKCFASLSKRNSSEICMSPRNIQAAQQKD